MAEADREYVLGSSDNEIIRLGFQHEVWTEATTDLWENAGITYAHRVADLGCGPGFATLELARVVGNAGHVSAVDASDKFVKLLKERVESLRIENIDVSKGDVTSLKLEADSYDFAFSRWLYCFLKEPERAAEEAHNILRPGGRLVILDYLNYLAAGVFPGSKKLNSVFQAYMKEVNKFYGSYNVGNELPAILEGLGFEIVSLTPINRIARPGEPVWQWVEMFNEISVPKLTRKRIWSAKQRKDFEAEWEKAKEEPGTFFFSPPMIGIVAEKVEQG
ncbi:MAG: methyltransferase domain-containing protein [Acidobacteria bacterium]|nr:MAG: methyltransferase domain-containing protein [Acidobacteriota bacterium]REK02509.1 MAG: methyltransferase domain-containing protein [Acidobacteriota bacterium]REK13689.1 MAG: methyltransferase domain-containing protein [Acidobacteriota bacterium]REK41683.1 MAG: methyltransferase domain-containing protein [Acidobacteriota bacterium]